MVLFYSRDQVFRTKGFHLASRGGRANKHPGNVASRELVREHAATYVATKKSERGAIARQLYHTHLRHERVFVIERDYFLKCLHQDYNNNNNSNNNNNHSNNNIRRRKLSHERVQSVLDANGGSLARIRALPPRVFLPTGDEFAIDMVDHLLRDEAKKIRRHHTTTNNNNHRESSFKVLSLHQQSPILDRQTVPFFGPREHGSTLPPCPTTAPVRSVSCSSEDLAPSSSQFSSSSSCSSSHTTTTTTTTRATTPLVNEYDLLSWESIHDCKNQTVSSNSGPVELSFGTPSTEDLTLWKSCCTERMTNAEHHHSDDLFQPMSSCILDNLWSNDEQQQQQRQDNNDDDDSSDAGITFLAECNNDDLDLWIMNAETTGDSVIAPQ